MNGADLKKLRNDHGVTQDQLADGLGYTTKGDPNGSMIARMENGHAAINRRLELAIIGFFFLRQNSCPLRLAGCPIEITHIQQGSSDA